MKDSNAWLTVVICVVIGLFFKSAGWTGFWLTATVVVMGVAIRGRVWRFRDWQLRETMYLDERTAVELERGQMARKWVTPAPPVELPPAESAGGPRRGLTRFAR